MGGFQPHRWKLFCCFDTGEISWHAVRRTPYSSVPPAAIQFYRFCLHIRQGPRAKALAARGPWRMCLTPDTRRRTLGAWVWGGILGGLSVTTIF